MNFFILTLGTRGDFELFRILGRELHRRGHRVLVGTSEFNAAQVRNDGLEFTRIGQGTREEFQATLRASASIPDRMMRTRQCFQRWLQPQYTMASHEIQAQAEAADYFISNLKMVLRRQGRIIPGARVDYDPPLPADIQAGPNPATEGRILDLVAMPRKLVDPQGQWGPHYRFTGFWWDEHPPAWAPPVELSAFLKAGLPPVVLTMGSMVMFDTQRLVQTFTEALRLAGQRGLIVGGWSGISQAAVAADSVYCVDEVPYDWLFPQASGVIHHGGCGTVAAVVRAGKPSILLPQIAAQEQFGWVLGRNGIATGLFDTSIIDARTLAGAIHEAATNEQFHQNARKWQKVIAEDRGVRAAVDLIEAHWQSIQAR